MWADEPKLMLPFKIRRVKVRLPERNLTRLFFFATAKLNICCKIEHHREGAAASSFDREKEFAASGNCIMLFKPAHAGGRPTPQHPGETPTLQKEKS